MIEGQPSVTAERVAVRRAIHQLLDRPLIFEDPCALTIVGPAREQEIRRDPHGAAGGAVGRALRAHLVIRSHVAEEELARAVDRGVRQYVVLGAGLDTFCCRNPYPGLRVFEVDAPATQAWKMERLRKTGLAPAGDTAFVPCEFGAHSIVDVLLESGLDRTRPAFFSWLGVTMYLEPSTTLRTIEALAPLATGGGGLVFDYSAPVDSVGVVHRIGFKILASRLARLGEPFIGFFDPPALVAAVKAAGFTEVDDFSPSNLAGRFLADRGDGLRLSGLGHVLCARA
jgi:methyltransferase (TIGR00027 family)